MTRLASTATLAAAFFALMGAASPAKAINAVCEVLPTPDGFAALRAGPSADARLIARMKTGHSVHLRARNQGEVIRSGRWTQVISWNGELNIPSQPEFRTGRIGWVAQRLIGDCG